MDKIYSRKRIKLANYKFFSNSGKQSDSKKVIKILKIVFIISIAILTANMIMRFISPIINKQCINMAKSIATKISNEQATIVMSKYKYEDLCKVTKDSNRKYSNG